ncbi:MAG: adenylyl-sulfate kinase [Deltaproteobacteria bacterium]|nr:adenylyl-sulfate kinase [Deltaproteobacteria bacterium]
MTEQKATNLTWHDMRVGKKELEKLHGHKGATIWFTGLSGSGKSTLANAVARTLYERGVSTIVLDGDNVRHGLTKDLGFTPEDRVENIRRVGEMAKLFTTAGVINLTAFISPYKSDRGISRELQPESFIEVFCDADLSVCEERDPKGIYKKVREGKIKNFTGIDAPYEIPENPEIRVPSGTSSVEECTTMVIDYLETQGILTA